jgi:hypothetical protein
VRSRVATSLRCAPICSDTTRIARRSRRRSQFRDHTDRKGANLASNLRSGDLRASQKSNWKPSHSRRIPSAFGTHPVPIRHPFFIPTVATTPKPALLAHIGNLGKFQTAPLRKGRESPSHRPRSTVLFRST